MTFPSLLRCLPVALALGGSLSAQSTKEAVLQRLDQTRSVYEEMALKIWHWAEVGYQETKSTALLQEQLAKAGFKIETGVAGIPTAFIATYGSGSPVIGIMAEMDALPGTAQEAVAERKEIVGQVAGHACGHNLFGAGSVASAVAIKEWLAATGQPGTIRLYGTPAEEGGSGKVYMVRAGLFSDVDVVLHWHPGSANSANPASSLANKSAKFRFKGIASHAAAAPERGRSALDGVEAMNHMANLMREHVPYSTRIHYVITRGGEAPNVVPAAAEVFYYVRSPSREVVADVWSRLEAAAQGAAMGTGTSVEWEVIHGNYELLPNETLARVMHRNLSTVGGVQYTEEEKVFATTIGRTFPGGRAGALELASQVAPFNPTPDPGSASTDVGDVSWAVPTVGLSAATYAPGTPGHSWQSVAQGGTSIGIKGMMVAAKTLATTAIDLFQNPATIAKAKEEFSGRRGAGFRYVPLLGDRLPPLDYRK